MAQFLSTAAMDAALNYVKTNATELRLVNNYSINDSYATVVANTLCIIAVASGDFTLANTGSNARKYSLAAKSGTATSSSSGAAGGFNHHWVVVSANAVLKVHNETGDAAVVNGNSINSPVLECTITQPVVG